MSAPGTVSDLTLGDVKNAKLSLKLSAKSGFRSTCTYEVSPHQWSEVLMVCEDGPQRMKMRASPALYDALKALVDAVLDGDETSAHQIAKYAALAALALARGEAA